MATSARVHRRAGRMNERGLGSKVAGSGIHVCGAMARNFARDACAYARGSNFWAGPG